MKTLQLVALVLGVMVSASILVAGMWGALWAVNRKVLAGREWLRTEIEATVDNATVTLKPDKNGRHAVGDLPGLFHDMKRDNAAEHGDIGDRLTSLEVRTAECPTWQKVKNGAERLVHREVG